jgi:hypothetical protein
MSTEPTTHDMVIGPAGSRPTSGGSSIGGQPAAPGEHRLRDAPDDHLCGCGRLRADCVRDTVRGLWSAPTA